MCQIIMYVLLVILLITILTSVYLIIKYRRAKAKLNELEQLVEKSKEEYRMRNVDYSNKLLDYIKIFVAQVASIKFRNFIDTHDITKINKTIVGGLIEEIAIEVKNSINDNNVIFQDALFTKEFYDGFIVQSTTIIVKDLLEKVIENNDMEEM